MTLDIKKYSDKLLLEITAFQFINDSEVKSAKMIITKDNIDYLEHIGCWLPSMILEELIRELYECNTDEDYKNVLNHFTEDEIKEILSTLDNKLENLEWHDE